ncbi:helix-turn-helix transcriptional regulator [Tamlana fucoidanivorans]|uniref:Helix-turn-helix transcriptional regulator n=1 Tax=Allotamlana fucoidanivorans TaxID=2583814 RepID=A0A5C4SQ83_9FLAO|nr:helix-turn-helix transcriptional regulator [Tamlana fucoidanivorans]TNJ46086.1 helix-turn-helix transcriptional regulator [Tamlana fucoidanivorans]
MGKLKPEDIALNTSIALRIKELRIKANPNQSKFADKHFIDRQIVSRWENINDKRGVSIHTINRFCKMVNISLKEFFDSDLFLG